MSSELTNMGKAAIAVTTLAVISIVGVAVIAGFRDTFENTTDEYTLAGKFITGIAVFGTFCGLLVLALVGKILIGMWRQD